jgi:hypothetical protein
MYKEDLFLSQESAKNSKKNKSHTKIARKKESDRNSRTRES